MFCDGPYSVLNSREFRAFAGHFRRLISVLKDGLRFRSFLFRLPRVRRLICRRRRALTIAIGGVRVITCYEEGKRKEFRCFLRESCSGKCQYTCFINCRNRRLSFNFICFFFLINIRFICFDHVFLLYPFSSRTSSRSRDCTGRCGVRRFKDNKPVREEISNSFRANSFFVPCSIVVNHLCFRGVNSYKRVNMDNLVLKTCVIPIFIGSFRFVNMFIFVKNTVTWENVGRTRYVFFVK